MQPTLTLDPLVAAGLAVSAALALFGPLLAALVFRRRTGAPWAALGFGALTFFVSQLVLRLPWQIGIGVWKKDAFAADPVLLLAWVAFSAFTAGLFEETGRYVAFRKVFTAEQSWRAGVMFGLGHGGLESVLLVGLSIAGNLVLYVLLARGVPVPLPEAATAAIVQQFAAVTPGLALLGGLERVLSMCVHVACSLAVLRAVREQRPRWYLAALGFHAVSNLVAVEVARRFGPFWAEGVIGVFAVAAVAFAVAERGRLHQNASAQRNAP